ncbi:ATP-binding protein [uncultured Polaribacter sp.]|uniref:tetratricopeptide repeat-containing sensor histidine kinase n=1 Tax=uncultured Polaribacter sp. TaxID=174711 RepID=UPI00261630D0|nr:ATP-binding protein [uncultured Polaribacter sp.]
MKNNYLLTITLIYFNIFFAKIFGNEHYTEEVFFKETSSVFFVENDSIFKVKYNEVIAIYKEENFQPALEKALEIYDYCKEYKNEEYSYLLSLLIAKIYSKTNNYLQALRFYKESLHYFNYNILNETNSNSTSAINEAEIYLKIGSSFQQLAYINKEKINHSYSDSAKFYYKKIESLPIFNDEFLKIKATMFSNLSGIYESESLYSKAEDYAMKAINIHHRQKDRFLEASARNNLGNIYLSQKKYKKAKDIYINGSNLIKNDSTEAALKSKVFLYYNLAWAMRNLNDYKAYDILEKANEIEDEIRDVEIKARVKELGYKYDFNTKKRLLKKDQELQIVKEKDKTRIIIIISFFIFILLISVIVVVNLRGKNLELKLTQIKLIQKQKLDKLNTETKNRILNATIDAKELERQEISEVLHDSVSALLSSANLHLQAARTTLEVKTPNEVNKAQEIISEASKKIRNLSHTLTSPVLTKFGLDSAIINITEKYSNSQLEIKAEVKGLRRYHPKFETKIYNIIQELLNNILKHSKATSATVSLIESNKKLKLMISDNGIGFNSFKFNEKNGIGLSQIEARIEVMKGTFKINSQNNSETIIESIIPVMEKDKTSHVLPTL